MQRVVVKWDGEAFHPIGGAFKICSAHFKAGERCVIEVREQRSDASHRQYFAAIHEAWMNLPEEAAQRYVTPEHLRKWCLVKAGFCDETDFVFESEAKAIAVAVMARKLDDYAIVTQKGPVVKVYRAKSQSLAAMGKEEFQASKTAVLDILSGQIGISRKALEKEGKIGRS